VQSRWGLEFGVQGGYDKNPLVPASRPGRDKPVDGADTLRHVSRANVSYLAPAGNGLTLTAGLFNSYIGYQSFYARNNLNHARSYLADNALYFMFGLGATYPLSDSWQVGLYAINGYNYLSHAVGFNPASRRKTCSNTAMTNGGADPINYPASPSSNHTLKRRPVSGSHVGTSQPIPRHAAAPMNPRSHVLCGPKSCHNFS